MRHEAALDLLCDPLTGALTRHRFDALLARSLEQAAAGGASAALLVIDIDHFKSINDSFGHARGDAVLVEVVRRLRETARAGDLLFRFGGDEFVLLLPTATPQQAQRVAERLLEVVCQHPFSDAHALNLTLSIGAASFPQDAATPEALFEAADRRVYQAKRAGRGRVAAADAQTRLAPAPAPERLIERDEALAAARDFLGPSDTPLRSLCLQAAPGVGRTRFLAELARAGVTSGYATLSVRGGPALRARRYGALVSSASDWPAPPPSAGPERFAAELAQAARSRGASRLLITIDDPSDIDAASLDFLREMLVAPALARVLLAYVDGPVWMRRPPLDTAPHLTASLRPLSAQGIGVWLRQVLRWEPPASLVAWVAATSLGLPRRVRSALDELIASGALVAQSGGWAWDANIAPDMSAAPAPATALLRQLDSAPPLVGRNDEIAQLRDLLLAERLVTVVGQGGVGKTRLALQCAAECHADFRDGAHFVPLAGVQSAAYIPAAIIAALQLPPAMISDPQARVLAHLSGREALLVLDNFEHLVDGGPALAEMLRGAPDLRLLITSRERLTIPDERAFVLDGLALPGGPGEAAAVQLFHQRARQVDPEFAPSEHDGRLIAQICRLLDGLPLGIELAASFIRTYSCALILDELERGLAFLTGDRPELPERHRSLTAVLDSFWEILSSHERRALYSLAVFRGGFTRAAARAVAGASPFFLDALTAKTFLRRTAGGRFEMHELLRQYAAEKLRARTHAEARANDRHSAYYLRLVTEAHAKPDRDDADLDELQVELDNIRAAWGWAVASRRVERVGASLHALSTMLINIGLLREGLAANQAALAQLADVAAERRDVIAHLEVMCGLHLYHMGRYAEALAVVRQAEELLGDLDAPLVRAQAHFTVGAAQLVLGDRPQSQSRFEQALALAGGDERLAVEVLYMLAHLANLASDSASGSAYGSEALQRARAAGYGRSERQALLFLGIGQIFQEQHDEARACLEPLVTQLGSSRQAMTDILALANLAQASWEVQEYARARAEVERAVGLARKVDMRYLEGIALRVRGLIALSTGGLPQAEEALAEALSIFQASSVQRDEARVLAEQALLAHRRGQDEAALAAADAALAIARRLQILPVAGHALIHRGHALLGLGDPVAAAASYRAGHEQFLALGRRNRAAEALAGVAEVELARGRPERARAYGRALLAHLGAGRVALGGMYDPARVCQAAYAALRAVDPAGAQAALAHGQSVRARAAAQAPLERAAAPGEQRTAQVRQLQ